MFALTLKPPWAYAVCRLGKRLENRTWQPWPSRLRPGHLLAIHGGKPHPKLRLDAPAAGVHRLMPPGVPIPDGLTVADVAPAGVVAVCRFGGIIDASDPGAADPWFEGPLAWRLEDLVPLPEVVPCRGQQGLWPLPADLEVEVMRLYLAAKESPAHA